jgi:hypothetical protein
MMAGASRTAKMAEAMTFARVSIRIKRTLQRGNDSAGQSANNLRKATYAEV